MAHFYYTFLCVILKLSGQSVASYYSKIHLLENTEKRKSYRLFFDFFPHPCTGTCETVPKPQGIPPVVLHQRLQALKHFTLIQIETSILILMDLNVFHFLVTDYHWQNDTQREKMHTAEKHCLDVF